MIHIKTVFGIPIQLLRVIRLLPTSHPCSIEASPRDPNLLAVATSAVPHTEVMIVRLLLPPMTESRSNIDGLFAQAAQTRIRLAIQDREAAAIQVHVSTIAPKTPYSTTQVVWRPKWCRGSCKWRRWDHSRTVSNDGKDCCYFQGRTRGG